jgi:hypothetical protein
MTAQVSQLPRLIGEEGVALPRVVLAQSRPLPQEPEDGC